MGNFLKKMIDPLNVVGTLGDVIGEFNGSTALASAQGRAANAQLGQQREDRTLATKYADSADEIIQLQRAVQTNQQDIVRQQRILDSTDPAVIEAGKQALNLMKGVESSTLAPLRSKLQKDEQTLRGKLLKQLGPGYENSTAGIQALNAFQESSSNALSNAQQTAINSYLGTAQNFSSQGLSQQTSQAGTLGSLYGNIAQRKVSAVQGSPINAGLQYAGEMASAQAKQQNFGQLMQIGGMAVGAVTGGIGGAALGGMTSGTGVNPQTINGVKPAGNGFTLGNGNYQF